MNLRFTIALLLALSIAAPVLAAGRKPSADEAVLVAYDGFRAGDAAKLAQAAALAQGHVLEPYLDYWKLKLRLEAASPQGVGEFLDRNAGTLPADQLRRDWLRLLGLRRQWELFQAELPRLVDEDPEITCYSLQARWQQQKDESAPAEVRAQWYAARELPEACVPLVEALIDNGQLTSNQVWLRIRLLYDAGLPSLAVRTAAYLPDDEAIDARQVDDISRAPVRYLERIGSGKQLVKRSGRELTILALLKLAKNDPQLAASYWDAKLREKFSAEDRAYVWGKLALNGARHLLPEALAWYAETGDTTLNDEQLAWYVRAALRQDNWAAVKAGIARMTSLQKNEAVWIYWQGRALQALGGADEARAQFARIAGEHHFYGRLAAEELGQAVVIPAKGVAPGADVLAAMAAHPGLQRALALYRLDLRVEGTREWQWALRGLDDRMLLAAADIASRNELWDRAIFAAERTVAEHDFSLRYVAPYRKEFGAAARAQQLDEAWVFGLVRQESRFTPAAKSLVGASGLMQIMPATAKSVAKKIGMHNYSWARIGDIDLNLRLGTAYLRHLLDNFDGQAVLASVAYNAGPGRARLWSDTKPLEGAIYAETIPFNETRDYVKKVMVNSIYYAAVLGDASRSLKARLGTIPARLSGERVLALKDEAAAK